MGLLHLVLIYIIYGGSVLSLDLKTRLVTTSSRFRGLTGFTDGVGNLFTVNFLLSFLSGLADINFRNFGVLRRDKTSLSHKSLLLLIFILGAAANSVFCSQPLPAELWRTGHLWLHWDVVRSPRITPQG